MAYGGRIDYSLGFKVDESGIKQLKRELEEISSLSATAIQKMNPSLTMDQSRSVMGKVRTAVKEVQNAMNSAFNTETGIMNLQALQNNLNKLNLPEIQSRFYSLGEKGITAFSGISKAALTANVNLKQTNSLIDKMGTTFMNTIKWSISSSIINNFTGAIQQAYGYVQHLDTSLNDIRIVTGKSADEMDKFAEKANEAAKALGTSTTEYTEASLIYYQQGLGDKEAQARAETTLKAANVTGQTGREVSEELTAVWNGYKVTAEETEQYVDKLAAVAATTASNLAELSTGMSKVASAANNMGVNVDQLNGMLATIISVTRQAPETAGTALKTIFARMEDLKISGEDEYGVKLGQVSGTLNEVGVQIMDTAGNMRDLGEVIEEVGAKWDSWTRAQQSAIAQSIAGKRQYNNLLALFDNWNMYQKAVETSEDSLGTLQKQQNIYMESTAAHIEQLNTEWEDLYDSLFDTKDINSILTGLTKILDVITDIVDTVGGGKGVLMGLVGLIGTTFSKQIGQAFGDFANNIKVASENAKILDGLLANINVQKSQGLISGNAAKQMTELQDKMSQYWHVMSAEEFNATQETIREIGEWETKKEVIQENTKKLKEFFSQYKDQATKKAINSEDFLSAGSTNQNVLLKRLGGLSNTLGDLKTRYKEVNTMMRQYNDAAASGTRTDKQRANSIDNIEGKLKGMKDSLQILHDQKIIDDNKFNSAAKVIEKLEVKLQRLRNMTPGTQHDSFAKQLIDDFRNLQSTINLSDEAIEGFKKALLESGVPIEEINRHLAGLNGQLHENELSARVTAEAWSNLIGGLTSVLFGFDSISNALSSLTDESISAGERIKKVFTALLLGGPMLLRGITNINTAIGTLTTSSKFLSAATRANILANKADTMSVIERTAAYLGLSASMLPLIAIMAALTAGIILLAAAYKNDIKQLEKSAEASKKNAERQAEKIEATRQEKEAIDELSHSYNSLLEQRAKDTEFTEDQKNQIYELVKAYGDEQLIVQALSGDYDKLSDSIAKAQEEANKQYIGELQTGKRKSLSSLTSNIKATAKETQRDKKGYDFAGYNDETIKNAAWGTALEFNPYLAPIAPFIKKAFGGTPQDTKQLQNFEKELAGLIGKTGQDIIDSTGHISWENLNAILTADADKLYDILDKYEDLKAADQIRDLLSSNSETIEEINRYEEELAKSNLADLGYKYIDEIKESVTNLDSFETMVSKLTQEALDLNLVKTEEEGRQWAKDFIGGLSDEFSQLEQQSYIADAILNAILPSKEEIAQRKGDISTTLQNLGEGGNVNLNNRPEINAQLLKDKGWTDAGDGYATVYSSTYGSGNKWINFTPIIVDPKTGEFIDIMTPEALEDYANKIIEGTGTDYNNLQIGGVFETAEEADAAAVAIHGLHAEIHGLNTEAEVTDEIYQKLNETSSAAQSYIADNIDIIKALIHQGWSVEEVFDNLQASIDMVTAEDHIIKIKAVFDEGFDGKKIEEKVHELFEDPSFDIGISEEDFLHLDSGQQAYILNDIAFQEEQRIQNLTEAEKAAYEERRQYLEDEIAAEAALLQTSSEQYQQATDKYNIYVEEQRQKTLELAEELGFKSNEAKEAVTEDYLDIAQAMVDAYDDAVAKGEDGVAAARAIAKEASDDVKKIIDSSVDNAGGMDQFLQGWSDKEKDVKKFDKAVKQSEKTLDEYNTALQKIPDTEVNWYNALERNRVSINEINQDFDNLQASYQNLTSAVEEYNSQGYLSLDTLEKIITMDSSYIASLEFVNGQLQLNNETFDQSIESKKQYLKALAAQRFLEEIDAIAKGNLVLASQKLDEAERLNQQSIQNTINKANEGVVALTKYAIEKAKASKDFSGTLDENAVGQSAQAFYNTLQLIDSTFDQPTSTVLGKGGSSSSSSSSAKEAKHEEYLEREVDLYRKINAELKQIESTLGRIQKENNYKWGKDLQKGLERENKLIDKQLAKLKQKKKLQEKDLSQQRANLENEGIKFSKDGSSMKNTESKLDELYKTYNSMVDKYNSMTADQQESYKKTLDSQKEYIDKIEKTIDKYESTFSDYQSTLDDLLDAHYVEIENAIKSFNHMVDVHLELDEAQKEWDDFWYEVVQDVDDTDFAGKIAQSMTKLKTLVGFGDEAAESTVATLTNHLNDTINEVQKQISSRKRGGEDSLFGNATELSKENLEKYRDALMDALREAKEEVDNISENYLKMLDSAQELLDKQVAGWEAISDHIEHNAELIKLINGEDAFDQLNRQYDKLYYNNLKLINTQKQGQDFWADEIKRYEDLLKVTDKNTVQWKTYSEGLKKASENYQKAVADLDKTVEKALKDLETWRKNQVDSITDTLDRAMTNNLGLDTVEEEWKLINDLSDKYLDNVERAYSIEEYTLDLNDAANAIGLSAANQEKLNKFRDEELRKLNEKEKLTQYDIDESRARLEILKQEMALEDARNNKSNLRLRRDSQGNYTYQFTGSEEDEEAGERGMLTAKKAWYELVKKRYKETADWIIELQKQQTTLHQEIADAEAVGDTERANKLRELYETNARAIQDAYAEAGKNVQDIYSGVAQYFADVNEGTILPTSKTTVRTLIDQWADKGETSFIGAVKSAIVTLDGVQQEYVERTIEILDEAGIAWEDLTELGLDPTIDALEDLVDTNEELADQLDEINNLLTDEEQTLRSVEDAYNSLKDAAVDAIQAANDALNTLAQTAIDTQNQVAAAVAAAQAAANAPSTPGSSPGGSGTGPGGINGGTVDTGYHLEKPSDTPTYSGLFAIIRNSDGKEMERGTIKDLQKNWKGKVKGLKSGGYTGEWARGIPGTDNGRLAILHQKELVLNETDTSNLLKAIYTLREMVAAKTNTSGIADQLVAAGNMQAQILAQVGTGILSSLASITTENANTSYRNMTVNADFSGVRSADAIYQALMELENYGMQNSYSVAPHMNTSF